MPSIEIHTYVKAPRERVFELARSIDLHLLSTESTNERAIAGKTSGLLVLGDIVIWRARHLGVVRKLSSKITAYHRPHFFVDEMIRGAFKTFKHKHQFEETDGVTLMTDLIEYSSPFGIIGSMADALFMKKYLTSFILKKTSTSNIQQNIKSGSKF